MGDCHYLYGNVMTVKRMRFLQELLDFVGLGGRLHLEWISSAEAQKFAQIATVFTEKLKAMGPSPVAVFTEEISAMGLRPAGQGQRQKTSSVSAARPVCEAWRTREQERSVA